MRWFTADLHLGHDNIIGYSGRPFDDVAAMDEWLIERWNALVGQRDEVWVVGDFALGSPDRSLPLVTRLAGRKVLVAGNHDRCWPGAGAEATAWTQRYLAAGFTAVITDTTVVRCAGQEVVVSHLPYHGDSCSVDRFPEHRPCDTGGWILHGHVHQRWQVAGRQINVGVDAWGGRPVCEEELAAVLADGPCLRPAAPWPGDGQHPPPWVQSGGAAATTAPGEGGLAGRAHRHRHRRRTRRLRQRAA